MFNLSDASTDSIYRFFFQLFATWLDVEWKKYFTEESKYYTETRLNIPRFPYKFQ